MVFFEKENLRRKCPRRTGIFRPDYGYY